jgi:hypothetical protein
MMFSVWLICAWPITPMAESLILVCDWHASLIKHHSNGLRSGRGGQDDDGHGQQLDQQGRDLDQVF